MSSFFEIVPFDVVDTVMKNLSFVDQMAVFFADPAIIRRFPGYLNKNTARFKVKLEQWLIYFLDCKNVKNAKEIVNIMHTHEWFAESFISGSFLVGCMTVVTEKELINIVRDIDVFNVASSRYPEMHELDRRCVAYPDIFSNGEHEDDWKEWSDVARAYYVNTYIQQISTYRNTLQIITLWRGDNAFVMQTQASSNKNVDSRIAAYGQHPQTFLQFVEQTFDFDICENFWSLRTGRLAIRSIRSLMQRRAIVYNSCALAYDLRIDDGLLASYKNALFRHKKYEERGYLISSDLVPHVMDFILERISVYEVPPWKFQNFFGNRCLTGVISYDALLQFIDRCFGERLPFRKKRKLQK